MKSFLTWVVVLGLIAGVGAYGYGQMTEQREAVEYDKALAALQKDFLIQSVSLRLLEPNVYRREVGVALTRYHQEVAQLGRELPGHQRLERELERARAQHQAGEISQEHADAVAERVDLTLALFDQMRTGQYRPLYTDADDTFRFDIHQIAPVEEGGTKRLRLSYVFWGAFGPLEHRNVLGTIRTEQRAGKAVQVPQIEATGAPPTLEIDPERWVKEFPPGVQIGYYDLPLLPAEATAVALSFDFGMRTVGGTPMDVHIDFGDIPVDASWTLPEGTKWAAHQRLVPDAAELEKLRGGDAATPDVH